MFQEKEPLIGQSEGQVGNVGPHESHPHVSITTQRVRLLLCVAVLLLASPAWANFAAFSGFEFSYCFYGTENIAGQTCSDHQFSLGGDCSAACGVPGNFGFANGSIARPWQVEGEASTVEGDAVFSATASVQAMLTADGTVLLSVRCFFADEYNAGPAELAVFRFDGDPTVFDGTSATSISELVDLGLIDVADVLFVEDCPSQGDSNFEVDLAGVPDSEVVIFVAGTAVPGFFSGPVPAISVAGAWVLALLLLGAVTLALRRV